MRDKSCERSASQTVYQEWHISPTPPNLFISFAKREVVVLLSLDLEVTTNPTLHQNARHVSADAATFWDSPRVHVVRRTLNAVRDASSAFNAPSNTHSNARETVPSTSPRTPGRKGP